MAGAGELSELARSVVERVRARLPGAPVAVALSGGADSAVCAWAVAATGATVRAITVDHGLPASASLVAAAGEIAASLGLAHEVVPAGEGRGEGGLRDVRYAALAERLQPGEVAALGHTADDQVETVLAHLLRGAGAAGLAGIPSVRQMWVRPILDVRRSETRALAAALGLPFVDDPDNADPALTRVKIRHLLVPLAEEIAPGAHAAISRAARFAGDDDEVLESRAQQIPVRSDAGEVSIPAAPLRMLPRAVAARVVRRALRIAFDPYPGSARDVEGVLTVACGARARLPLAGGLVVARQGAEVVIHPPGEPPPPPPPVAFDADGVSWGPWSFSLAAVGEQPTWLPIGRWKAVVPEPVLGGARVRCVVPGDRIEVRGGSKPVFEALREAGVASRRRLRWPVVEAGGRMVWVPGARVAESAAWRRGAGPAMLLSVETGM